MEITKRKPDYAAFEGISVWVNQDKNGQDYLSITIPLLKIQCNAFKLGQNEKPKS